MKTDEEIMEILEAFDLTGSTRAAAALAGCDHHTVARYVTLRAEGRDPGRRAHPERLADPYREKIEEWVERSGGRIRADIAHERLEAMGYRGSERTTRRALAEAKHAFRAGRRRVYRPWVPEPGMWLQWDFGQGPRIAGRVTWLFCLWLAWSRFRVVVPIWDRTLASVTSCLDRALRVLGGVPTYALTDNERTVTTDHIARIAVRHPDMLAFCRHYGLQVATCVVADPESKGGVEATVRIAKADLVPTDANLVGDYASFAALEVACAAFMDAVNARPHRATGRPPAQMLAEERLRLHPLPATPHTLALGQARTVARDATISLGSVRYSVPWQLVGSQVLARVAGEELVVVALTDAGPREVARHALSTPGNPRIADEHYPPRPAGPLARTAKAQTPAEAEFLALGPNAERWLVTAAASGQGRIRAKMAAAVTLAKLHGPEALGSALGACAEAGRFGEDDLALVVAHRATQADTDIPSAGEDVGAARRAGEGHTLQAGTGAWAGVGR